MELLRALAPDCRHHLVQHRRLGLLLRLVDRACVGLPLRLSHAGLGPVLEVRLKACGLRSLGQLRISGQEPVEDAADVVVDRRVERGDGAVDLGQPLLEATEDAAQRLAGGLPLHEVGLGGARELLVLLGRELPAIVAKPRADRLHIGAQLRRRGLDAGVAGQLLEPRMARLVNQRRAVRVLEKADGRPSVLKGDLAALVLAELLGLPQHPGHGREVLVAPLVLNEAQRLVELGQACLGSRAEVGAWREFDALPGLVGVLGQRAHRGGSLAGSALVLGHDDAVQRNHAVLLRHRVADSGCVPFALDVVEGDALRLVERTVCRRLSGGLDLWRFGLVQRQRVLAQAAPRGPRGIARGVDLGILAGLSFRAPGRDRALAHVVGDLLRTVRLLRRAGDIVDCLLNSLVVLVVELLGLVKAHRVRTHPDVGQQMVRDRRAG